MFKVKISVCDYKLFVKKKLLSKNGYIKLSHNLYSDERLCKRIFSSHIVAENVQPVD